eukprot:COSAG06_NODE_68125_length_239_cov_3.014286_2_plen_31_part_01
MKWRKSEEEKYPNVCIEVHPDKGRVTAGERG